VHLKTRCLLPTSSTSDSSTGPTSPRPTFFFKGQKPDVGDPPEPVSAVTCLKARLPPHQDSITMNHKAKQTIRPSTLNLIWSCFPGPSFILADRIHPGTGEVSFLPGGSASKLIQLLVNRTPRARLRNFSGSKSDAYAHQNLSLPKPECRYEPRVAVSVNVSRSC